MRPEVLDPGLSHCEIFGNRAQSGGPSSGVRSKRSLGSSVSVIVAHSDEAANIWTRCGAKVRGGGRHRQRSTRVRGGLSIIQFRQSAVTVKRSCGSPAQRRAKSGDQNAPCLKQFSCRAGGCRHPAIGRINNGFFARRMLSRGPSPVPSSKAVASALSSSYRPPNFAASGRDVRRSAAGAHGLAPKKAWRRSCGHSATPFAQVN